MWVIEAIDYPNEMLGRRARRRPHQDSRGHQRRRQGGQVHRLRRRAESADSLVFVNGGIIVSSTPNFLFLKDTNGDDKADVRQILSSGWGTNDTHAMASNLMYGHDNYIWGTVGYSGFNGQMNGTADAVRPGHVPVQAGRLGLRLHQRRRRTTRGASGCRRPSTSSDPRPTTIRASTSRFRTATSRGSTGIPNGTANGRGVGPGYRSIAQFYALHPMTPYIRQVDVFGGYTAGAGHQLYTARAFPKEYWNRIAFIAEPTAHLLGQGVHREERVGLRHARRLEPGREQRGVVRAGSRAGRAGRRRVDGRLVQLHHPAQSDAAGLQQRRGQRLRVVAARPPARPHLPHRLQGRAGAAEAVAVDERCRRACGGALVRQHVLAAARSAPDHRARPEGRRAAAPRARAQSVGGYARPQRRRAACALDAARPGRAERHDDRGVSRGRRGAEASGRGRAEGRGDGAAQDGRRCAARSSMPARWRMRICRRGWPSCS